MAPPKCFVQAIVYQRDSPVLLCHHNVEVHIILFIPLNDCPSYDSPVPQFRLATQKEGEEPAPDMDKHLTALVANICGGGRCWKSWVKSSLVKSTLPQLPCLALTHFHVLPTRQVGR